jgi:ribonuclease HI
VVLQVEDSLGIGTDSFIADELRESVAFVGKGRVVLDKNPINFNGFTIQRDGDGNILMHQVAKLSDMAEAQTTDEYSSIRAKGAYIATCTRPDLAAPFQLLISSDPTTSQFRKLNKLSARCREIASIRNGSLRFKRQDLSSLRLLVFTDAAFANAEGYASQLGTIIVLADGEGRANILHWFSPKSKRVTRSVAAAELHALVHGLDVAFLLAHTLHSILQKQIEICAYTDSRILFNSVTGFRSTAEKRLLIDLHGLRQSYNRREISEIAWIAAEDNLADPLTKAEANPDSLLELMRSSKLPNRRVRFTLPELETPSEYVVDKLVDAAMNDGGHFLYRTRWMGYNEEDDTWQEEESLPKHFIRRYWRLKGLTTTQGENTLH